MSQEENQEEVQEEVQISEADEEFFQETHDDLKQSEESNSSRSDFIASRLSDRYYGEINYMQHHRASTLFTPHHDMILDSWGLVHNGTVESAAQFCALLAVNENNAIISQTKSEFLAPISESMEIKFLAKSFHNKLAKRTVRVRGTYKSMIVYESFMSILVSQSHILDTVQDFKFTVKGNNYVI